MANALGMNLKSYMKGATPFPPVKKYRKKRKEYDIRLLQDFRLLEKEIYKQAESLPRKDIILKSFKLNGLLFVVKNINDSIELANLISSETLLFLGWN